MEKTAAQEAYFRFVKLGFAPQPRPEQMRQPSRSILDMIPGDPEPTPQTAGGKVKKFLSGFKGMGGPIY